MRLDHMVRFVEQVEGEVGLREAVRFECLGRVAARGANLPEDRIVDAISRRRAMEHRGTDTARVADDGSAAGIGEAAEPSEIVTAGDDAGVDDERDCAVRRLGELGRRVARSAPERRAASGEAREIAGQVGPEHAFDGAEGGERVVERGGSEGEVAGRAGRGEHPEPLHPFIFEHEHAHGGLNPTMRPRPVRRPTLEKRVRRP